MIFIACGGMGDSIAIVLLGAAVNLRGQRSCEVIQDEERVGERHNNIIIAKHRSP